MAKMKHLKTMDFGLFLPSVLCFVVSNVFRQKIYLRGKKNISFRQEKKVFWDCFWSKKEYIVSPEKKVPWDYFWSKKEYITSPEAQNKKALRCFTVAFCQTNCLLPLNTCFFSCWLCLLSHRFCVDSASSVTTSRLACLGTVFTKSPCNRSHNRSQDRSDPITIAITIASVQVVCAVTISVIKVSHRSQSQSVLFCDSDCGCTKGHCTQ